MIRFYDSIISLNYDKKKIIVYLYVWNNNKYEYKQIWITCSPIKKAPKRRKEKQTALAYNSKDKEKKNQLRKFKMA